jgi:wyosine [tRNA(Phe)-imidazoG37] synthetase (radical SAM superfamily)
MSLHVRSTIQLQQGILYGPVLSRRLGRSLGLNILPDEIKVCSMNCRYCQYSWTGLLATQPALYAGFLPSRDQVRAALQARLGRLMQEGTPPDTLTFSGNGEATLHPDFPGIVEDVVALRDLYAPACRTAILSNSTTVDRPEIRAALELLDDPILKLDTAVEETFRRLNGPAREVRLAAVLRGLRAMGSRAILQCMFVNGRVDNTTPEEVSALVEAVRAIGPNHVQIYTLDRGPADLELCPVPPERLEAIAAAIREGAETDARVFL